MILVTGATGQLGAKIVEALLPEVPAGNLAVSVRKPEKAASLRASGVDIRQADFNDKASLDTAFKGVGRLLIVSTDGDNESRIRQHLAAVAAAKTAGVRFIAYTSVARADVTPLWLGDVHRTTEEAIRATGIPFSFLRNNWYIENEVGAIRGVLAGGPITTSAGEGKVGWATRDDYAQAAAAVLAGDGHNNSVYELAGAPITYGDLAAIVSRVLGREVPIRQVNDAEFEKAVSNHGLPAFVVKILVNIQGSIREGGLDVRSDDLAKLLGRPATALAGVIAEIAKSSLPSAQPPL